jgi:hypothetical protein
MANDAGLWVLSCLGLTASARMDPAYDRSVGQLPSRGRQARPEHAIPNRCVTGQDGGHLLILAAIPD